MGFDDENESFKSSSKSESNQMSGYLYKKSTSGDWQRRYFETNGTYLTYYKTQKMTKLLAALSVPQVGSIKLIGEIDDNKGNGAVFQVDLKDRQYLLRAASLEEAKRWVDFLVMLRDGKSKPNNPLNQFGTDTIDSVKFVDPNQRSSLRIEPKANFQKSTRSKICKCC